MKTDHAAALAAVPRVREGADHPRPPRHLSAASRRLWRRIVADYDLEPHGLAILTTAMEAADRVAEARLAIDRDGPYVEGRFGLKAHPALAVERDARIAMVRCLRELALDDYVAASSRPARYR